MPADANRRGALRSRLIRTLLLVLWLEPSTSRAAPITFNTALPVSKGHNIARQQAIVARAGDVEDGVARSATEVVGLSVLGYGATRNLALFAVLPVVYRKADIGGVETSAFGLGDAALIARYEIFRADAPGATVRVAPFAGVVLPTGERGKTGDGSTDALAGVIVTAATTRWNLDGQVQYVANTLAKGFERGDAFSFDASFQRRIPALSTPRGFFLAVLETNVTHFQKNRTMGAVDPDSGGVHVLLSPGVQYAAKRWIVEAAVRLPVIDELKGEAIDPDYSVIAGLRVNF
jgi:hypothetical protein